MEIGGDLKATVEQFGFGLGLLRSLGHSAVGTTFGVPSLTKLPWATTSLLHALAPKALGAGNEVTTTSISDWEPSLIWTLASKAGPTPPTCGWSIWTFHLL